MQADVVLLYFKNNVKVVYDEEQIKSILRYLLTVEIQSYYPL